MAVSKAQQRAVAKYMKNNYDELKVRIKKGLKDTIDLEAKEHNESLNAYVKRAIQAQYKSETGKDIEL